MKHFTLYYLRGRPFLLLLLILHLLQQPHVIQATTRTKEEGLLLPSNHTKNVAVILSSSTFYHNYRHSVNALSIYQSLKQHGGFTDDNIILMLADEVACNARNPYKDTIYPMGRTSHNVNLFDNAQIDYGGNDVTVDHFFRVLLGRHAKYTPRHQRLHNIDEDTNLFLYITGHGGDGFFKFRDKEDFTTRDLRGIFEQLQIMKRFKSILYVSDTCQAFTTAPNTQEENKESAMGGGVGGVLRNVYSIGSSLKKENSYAHHSDMDIGHSVMDRYVYHFVTYMGGFGSDADQGLWKDMDKLSIKDAMVNSMYNSQGVSKLGANVGWSDLGCERSMDEVPLSDFMVMRTEGGGIVRDNKVGVMGEKSDDLLFDKEVFLIEHAVDFGKE